MHNLGDKRKENNGEWCQGQRQQWWEKEKKKSSREGEKEKTAKVEVKGIKG